MINGDTLNSGRYHAHQIQDGSINEESALLVESVLISLFWVWGVRRLVLNRFAVPRHFKTFWLLVVL